MLINPGEDLATNNYLSQKQNKDAIQGRDFASRRAPFRHHATMDVYRTYYGMVEAYLVEAGEN